MQYADGTFRAGINTVNEDKKWQRLAPWKQASNLPRNVLELE